MNLHIPKWMIAAFVGAAPMLGLVFFILFSCTLLGLVQRCKINLTKSYANRRKSIIRDRLSIDLEDLDSSILFKPATDNVIISPFDDIPMQDIDADSASKSYSEPKDFSSLRRNRSTDACTTGSEYDNGSSSIFNDNDYEQDRLSLIETSSQRKSGIKRQKTPDTIIHV